jgi:glyoxylase-like metal-dependent hydrolase (beta-lactamase superfamily II)
LEVTLSMQPNRVTDHVFAVDTGPSNVYLIVLPDGLTLIDAGFPGTAGLLEEAVRSLARRLDEIRDVLVTHSHPDHAAGLAEVKKATGAKTWMHPLDAAMVREGRSYRPWKVAPGFSHWLFTRRVINKSPKEYEPAEVEGEAMPGETIPVAGGVKAVGTPGHTAGHLAFLWPGDDGVLFTGDAVLNLKGIGTAHIYEDFAQGRDSIRALGELQFDVACFAHGAPVVGGASEQFKRAARRL